MTLRITKLAALALVATLAAAGTAFASGDCPEGYMSVDSNGWGNKVGISTKGVDEYVAIDQSGNKQVLKGKLVGDCIALVAGQYGKFNRADFKIVGNHNAVGVIQRGNSHVEVDIDGIGSTLGADLKKGTNLKVQIKGNANVSITQG